MHSDLELLRLERALQERADPCRDRQGTFAMACGAGLFGKPSLALQSCLVNGKAQGRATVDDFALCPLAQEPTNALARHEGGRLSRRSYPGPADRSIGEKPPGVQGGMQTGLVVGELRRER